MTDIQDAQPSGPQPEAELPIISTPPPPGTTSNQQQPLAAALEKDQQVQRAASSTGPNEKAAEDTRIHSGLEASSATPSSTATRSQPEPNEPASKPQDAPAEQLFTTTGRPARSASNKPVNYVPDWDKDGIPLKSKTKDKDKDRPRKDKSSSQAKERRARSPSASKSSAPPENKAGSSGTTRSGRQVTKPVDRHRSSAREARRNAKKTKALLESKKRESDESHTEDEDEGEDEVESISAQGTPVNDPLQLLARVSRQRSEANSPPKKATRVDDKHQTPPVEHRTRHKQPEHESDDDMDLLKGAVEEDAPVRPAKRVRTASNRDENTSSKAEPEKRTPVASKKTKPANSVQASRQSAQDDDNRPPRREATERATPERVDEPPEPASATSATSSKAAEAEEQTRDSGIALSGASSRASSSRSDVQDHRREQQRTPEVTRPNSSSPSVSTPSPSSSEAKRSFSGKPLTSLLGASAHRRPGLTRRSFVPPLHTNRKPPPPPKLAPTMTRKEREAQRKEDDTACGSDDSDDSDEERKKPNPFEEEIEGFA